MASGGEAAPSLLPCEASAVRGAGKEGATYVKKMVDFLMNTKNHKRILGKKADDPAKKLLTQLYDQLAFPVDRDGEWVPVRFDSGLVTKLVSGALFQEWEKDAIECWSPSQSGDGFQSSVSREDFSKSVKLEVLALLEQGATSDRVDALQNRELVSSLDGPMGSRSARGKSCKKIFSDDGCLQVGSLAVCDNAHKMVTDCLVESGGAQAVAKGVELGVSAVMDPVGHGESFDLLDPVMVDAAAERCPEMIDPAMPVVGARNGTSHHLQESLSASTGDFCYSGALKNINSEMGEDGLRGLQPICENAAVTLVDAADSLVCGNGGECQSDNLGGGLAGSVQSQDLGPSHVAPGFAMLQSSGLGCSQLDNGNSAGINAAAGMVKTLDLVFQPPAPGVLFQEWVKVATDNRKGSKRGSTSAGARLCARTMNDVASSSAQLVTADFPPLSRAGEMGARVSDVVISVVPPFPGAGDGGGVAMELGPEGSLVSTPVEGMNCAEQKLEGASKIAWKDLMRSNKPADIGVDLHFVAPTIIDGEPCAVFSADEEEKNLVHWKHSLLCYVVGKSPSYYQFCKAVNRLWKPPGGVKVFSRENGLFYCRFSCEEDLCRVIKDGPWYMDGKLIVVKKFVGATNCEEAMLSCIPIWVKLPCLPVQWWSISGVSKVVSPIGHPLYFDVPSASQSRIAYARCCVEVSMDKELPEFVTCVGGDKVKRRQKIAYDWVPKKCSYCKSFGHLVADCENELNKDGAKIQKKNEPGNIKRGGQQLRSHMGKSALQEIKGARSIEDDQGEVSIQNILMMGGPKISNVTNAAHSLSIIVEESPEDLAGLGSEGSPDDLSRLGSKGKHLLVGSDDIDHMRDSQQLVSEDEESAKDQVSTSSKEEMKGSGGSEENYECISIPPCRGGGSDGIDSGNLDDYAMMIPEDSDFIKNNKKKKGIRKKPAPVRPPGSRTTRHSGNIPMLNA